MRRGSCRARVLTWVGLLSLLLPAASLAQRPVTVHAAPNSVTIAGSLQSALGCTGDWQPDCAATHLAYDAKSDVWRGTWPLPANTYEYKAALNDSWTENYGLHAAAGGDNIPLHLPAPTSVTFYYDDKTHWVTDNQSSIIASVPGDFQTALGCPGDWDPSCLRSWLQDPGSTGTYSFETTALSAGQYHAKVTINESWGENYGVGGARDGGNIPFTVPTDHAKVAFRYSPSTHLLTITAGHAHDNNVEYDGLGHDSRDTLYRVPFGSVAAGTPVTLRFRTFHNDVTGVRVRLWDTATKRESFKGMTIAAANVPCYDPALDGAGNTCDLWQATVASAQPTTLYYRFIVTDGTSRAYYADDKMLDGGWGEATPNLVDNSYAITVYDSSVQHVSWLRNAVIYQVFPDRFRNGTPSNDPQPSDPRYGYPPNADDQIIMKQWGALPEGYCRSYTGANAATCPPTAPGDTIQGPHGRDYFGGDLTGLLQKLDYLQRLGVSTIYLNPIFASASSHGYDTRDYMQINPYFGNEGQFRALISAAHDHGIKVILDGVFNHVSSDSPYFDRYHHFSTVGACESASSPYRSWFTFQPVNVPPGGVGAGPCAGSTPNTTATYASWAGFDSLPVLNKNSARVRDLIYAGQDSVAKHWLRLGADGWRLDVMSDPSFPTDYWQGFRAAVKSVNPNAAIICECWKKGDVLPMVHGDTADTTMDYRFRDAILGFFGTVDSKGFPDDGESNQSPKTFADKLLSEREDYPDFSYYTSMKLLDSHDTERILWSLTPGASNRTDRELTAANLARGKQLLQLAAVVQMTTPGAPTIYYGDEVGVTGGDDPDNRRTFPWADAGSCGPASAAGYFGACGDHALFDHYRRLIALRSSHPVLATGSLHFLVTDSANRTLAYLMRSGTDAALIAINRDPTQTKTLSIPSAGLLPRAVHLSDALGTVAPVAASNGVITITLPPLGAAILMPDAGQDLTPPAAPSALVAKGGNSQVALTWSGPADAASYAIYRSPVSGGGYTPIGTSTGTGYVDPTPTNGRRYFYTVRAQDAAGNESDNAGEAAATPSFPIGWANVQWPYSITETITVKPTETIYGQIWVHGLTDAGGDPASIVAQLGFGDASTPPASWNTWVTMSFNATAGNNYEYRGTLRPEHSGVYAYVTRYSTDGGFTWTYAGINGPIPGDAAPAHPGILTVNASGDTSAPTSPGNLHRIDAADSFITIAWDAATDSTPADDSVAEYWVYRWQGSDAPQRIAIVNGSQTTYTDDAVDGGETYSYSVSAVDTSLNVSSPSNTVQVSAEQRQVRVVFNLAVPTSTDSTGLNVHIAGNFPNSSYPQWDPGASSPPELTLTRVDATHWTTTLTLPEDTSIEYKYALGSWDYVEKGSACNEINNRTLGVSYGTGGAQTVNDTVANWRNVAPCGS